MPKTIRDVLGAAAFYTLFTISAATVAAVLGGGLGLMLIYMIEHMR